MTFQDDFFEIFRLLKKISMYLMLSWRLKLTIQVDNLETFRLMRMTIMQLLRN